MARNPYRADGNDEVAVNFSFAPNAAAAPLVSSFTNAQIISSIVHTATGVFTIALNCLYPSLICAPTPGIALTANLDLKAQWGAITPAVIATGVKWTFVLNILAVNTLTDIAANAANRIHVALVFRETNFLPA